MITTVTLDPWLELNMRLPALTPGAEQTAHGAQTAVCGAGVGVSIALRALGLANIATGISFDGNGALLDEQLERHTVCGSFVRSHGQIRTELRLLEEASRTCTVIRSGGDAAERVAVERYLQRLQECAQRSSVVAFCGALPQGAGDDLYRRSLAALKGIPARTVLAASGKPLREALRRKPDMVCLSAQELRETFRSKAATPEELLDCCQSKLIARGVRGVCLLSVAGGALVADAESAFYAPGADFAENEYAAAAALAGLCKAVKENAGPERALRCTVAAATLAEKPPLRCYSFESLLPQARVQRLWAAQQGGAEIQTKDERH